ncbi:MAG: mechanosensitive ion channel [Acidobacteriota bacterium]|nr:mechanosensitive ion channel [Acidobacteriota bacterium]
MLNVMMDQITQVAGPYIPRIAAALGILIVGWLIALIVGALLRAVMRRTAINDRMAAWFGKEEGASDVHVDNWVGRGAYYLIMLFVLVAVFQTLGLTILTEPLNRLLTSIFEFAPRILGAGFLLIIAWILASVLRLVIAKVLTAARLDERLRSGVGEEGKKRPPLARSLADAVYWLIFLLFLPGVLNALAVEGLLEPIQAMVAKVAGFIPNLFTAAVILGVGWFVARIVQRVVSSLLSAVGLDTLSEKGGLSAALGTQRLSGVVGLIAYILVFLPVVIAALNALKMEAITVPASNMLTMILEAIPAIFGAVLILTIAYLVGRVVSGLVANLLAGAGFNGILAKLGLGKETGDGDRTPSAIVGTLILVAIMLFAVTEAAGLMGFAVLAELTSQFLVFAGRIVVGLVIFAIGLFLANFVQRTVLSAGAAQSRLLALGARIAIIVLSGAMALRHMGLADEIVNMAFGLILGAVAVALAIAFGLGGREFAARHLEGWLQSMKSEGAAK